MGTTFTRTIEAGSGNSVISELTRDFMVLLKASKQVLGLQHTFTTSCRHASAFPNDRMSLSMIWDEFNTLSVAQRAELLLLIRKKRQY
jgi:hypothetical protein